MFTVTDLITFSVFLIIIALLIFKDRKKVKREGVMLIRRTTKGRDLIDSVARRNPRFWNMFSMVGIAVAVPALVLVSIFLVNNAYIIMFSEAADTGVRLLLPGPVSQPVFGPSVLIFPWWIWLIGVMSVMIPHEFSHGIMCRIEKIRIRAVGWVLLFIIPGAFVEPDEKQLKKAKKSTKLKVYAAGSFANITFAFIIVIAFTAMFPLMFTPAGVYFQSVDNSTGNATMISGFITEIDSRQVKNPQDVSTILESHRPGDSVNVKASYNDFYFIPYLHPSGNNIIDFVSPKLGTVTEFDTESEILVLDTDENGKAVLAETMFPAYSSGVDIQLYYSIVILIIWIYIFNLGIGLINLLPIKPLDGGLIFEVIAENFSRRSAVMVRTVSSIMIAFLIFNLIGPWFV